MDTNVIFRCFCFPQTVWEQNLGEVGTERSFDGQLSVEIFIPKIIKILQSFFKLQLKMLGIQGMYSTDTNCKKSFDVHLLNKC